MGIVFRQSFKGTIINLIGVGIGFITTFFVVTELLTPEEIGLTRVLVEAATLVGGYALLATNSSAIRYYPYFRTTDGKDGGFLRLLLIIPLIGILIFGALYLFLRAPLVHFFAPKSGGVDLFQNYYYVVLPLMLFITYQTVLEVYCSLRQRIAIPKLSREVILRLLLLFAYLVYGFGMLDFRGFIAIFVLSYGVMMGVTLLYSFRIAPNALGAPIVIPEGKVQRDFRNYTLFTVLSAMGSSIVQRLDLFMVSSELGMASAGVYTIAFFIVAVVEMPSRSLSAMSAPLASAAIHSGDYREVNRIFREVSNNQLLIGSALLLLIWINVGTIFWVIPNSAVYIQGKWVIFFLGLGKLVDLSFSFGNAILRYSKYYFWTLAYTIIVMVVTILLNLYFIEYWGITGAAIATMITFVISYTFQQLVLWRKMQVTPVNWHMVRIIVPFGLLLGVDYLLPHLGHPILDSMWRMGVIGIFGWLMMRREETFRRLMSQIGDSVTRIIRKL
ncbi:polysaccharide biosynthesis protein [Porphyromonas levii]|uniref:Lipopolysaccharide biosynthesis protein n=1 Tax=Porphyromonas levii TaxID=28114 RepID=A0A4Y8WMG1_9PORP|nr:polysaccharide biosynthesis C-terminal domain-containing protein [Porphyromonas levii]TFH94238.1 lipopolysaccharide biosynthesis protein [Porphyromonas levii]TFH96230.1 lipopolysaccharide biosynthesis protein [Porphyromonas levii]